MGTALRKTATLLLEPEFIFLTLGWLAMAGVGRDKWECRSDQKECSHYARNDSHMGCRLEDGFTGEGVAKAR